jgi:hypothetical protein
MKRFLALALAALSAGAPAALAQDSLPSGDIAVFSAFRARIVAYHEVNDWVAEHRGGGRPIWVKRLVGYGRDGREFVDKFLAKHGAAPHPVDGDSLTLAMLALRTRLEPLAGRALDSAWTREMTLWLDEARVRAIFTESKQLAHKDARRAENHLRGIWGFPYGEFCAGRRKYERKGLDGRDLPCGRPPEPQAEASRPRAEAS